MSLLTETLAEQRQDLITSWQQQQDSVGAGWVANITAGWKAQATIASYSDNPQTVQWGRQLDEDADLQHFDAQSKTAEDSYWQQLLNTYGAGYAQSASYAQQMVDLENSLAQQRLAIQAQYAEQAKQAQASAESSISGIVTNLTGYITSLQTGSASPLDAQAQYGLAQSQFDTTLQAAEGGNATACSEVQSYAQAFLSASQNLYGSGAGYAADYSEVLQALQAIASIPQDALTASFMAAQLQDQTDILAGALAGLDTRLASIQVELQQQNAKP